MNHSDPTLREIATRATTALSGKAAMDAKENTWCVCREQPEHPVRNQFGGTFDILVMDAVVDVPYRCRLCGKKFTVQVVPIGWEPA
jgi:hypothetical protein